MNGNHEFQEVSDFERISEIFKDVAAQDGYTSSDCDPQTKDVISHIRLVRSKEATVTPQEVCDRILHKLRRQMLLSTKGPMMRIDGDAAIDLTLHVGYPLEMRSPTQEVTMQFLRQMQRDAEEISNSIADISVLAGPEEYHQVIEPFVRQIAASLLPSIRDQLQVMSKHSRIAGIIMNLDPNVPQETATLESVILGFKNPIILGLYMHHMNEYLRRHGYELSHKRLYQDLAQTLEPYFFGAIKIAKQNIETSESQSYTIFDMEGSFLLKKTFERIQELVASKDTVSTCGHCPALTLEVWLSSVQFAESIAQQVKRRFQNDLTEIRTSVDQGDTSIELEKHLIAGNFIVWSDGPESDFQILQPDNDRLIQFESHPYLQKLPT